MNLRHILVGFIFYIFPSILFSQIKCDTLLNIEAADGVNHIRCKINDRHIVNIVSIDLTNPDLKFESFRADSLQRTTTQASANEEIGKQVIAAINGDFFSFQSGFPINGHVQNSVPVFIPKLNQTQLIFSDKQKPFLENLSISIIGIIKTDTFIIDGVNRNNNINTIKLFNKFGALYKLDNSNLLIDLRLLKPINYLNDTISFVITNLNSNLISNDSLYILSIPKSLSPEYKFNLSDTVKIIFSINPMINNVTDIISGNGHLLKNNFTSKEDFSKSFHLTEHPRTLIGFNYDTTKFYFFVVDGRQTSSIGMSFETMVEVLKFWNISNALNLDGGGSTTMVIHNQIVNSPSDFTGERNVANSLQLISKTPLKKFISERKNYVISNK